MPTLIFAGLVQLGLLARPIRRKRILISASRVRILRCCCAYAPAPELIAARAALGAGGAAIMPSMLAIIVDVFPRPEQARAIGIWAGSIAWHRHRPVVRRCAARHFWWGSVFCQCTDRDLVLIAVALIAGVEEPPPVISTRSGCCSCWPALVTFIFAFPGATRMEQLAESGDDRRGLGLLGAFGSERRIHPPALEVACFATVPFPSRSLGALNTSRCSAGSSSPFI